MKRAVIGAGLTLVLVVGGAAAFQRVSADGSSQGKAVAVRLTPEQALAGEKVTISGKAGPQGRLVLLQHKDAGLWVEGARATTGETGRFSFDVTASDPGVTYRVRAERTAVDGTTWRARSSAEIPLAAVQPSASLALFAPIGQTSDGKELTPGEAVVVPAREGATVSIESNVEGDWSRLASGRQDRTGRFSFVIPAENAAAPEALRAVTQIPGITRPIYSSVVAQSAYDLVWHDEFNGSKFSADWSIPPAKMNRVCNTIPWDTARLRDGVARLRVERDPRGDVTAECPKGSLYGAQIRTSDTKSFTYGTFAARMKVHKPTGAHSAFYLLPTNWDDAVGTHVDPNVSAADAAGSRGAEIDVMEYFGDNNANEGLRGAIQNSLYFPIRQDDPEFKQEKRGGRRDTTKIIEGKPSDAYHVYSVEWTPTEYIFRVDGTETFRVTEGISHRPEFLLFTMQTSAWEFRHLDLDDLPAYVDIDWVRVWQK